MATYLYGLILDRNAHLVPSHIVGIHGSTLRVVHSDPLVALVSTVERKPARASLDDVRAHDHALQAVVHHGSTAAATRFGQSFPDDDDARRHVREGGARIAKVLDEYDGCVEMRLLVPTMSVAAPPRADSAVTGTGPGRAYLEGLRSRSDVHLKGLALQPSFGPLVRAERVEELAGSRGVAFAHLVQRDQESEYRSAVAHLPSLAKAEVVGPLAFYSFAEQVI